MRDSRTKEKTPGLLLEGPGPARGRFDCPREGGVRGLGRGEDGKASFSRVTGPREGWMPDA